MMNTCYGCCYLIQGGDGSNGCLKFSEPGYPAEARHLDAPPEPLYLDCYEERIEPMKAGSKRRVDHA